MKILKYISAAVLVLCVYSLYAMKGTYTAEWGAAQARKARQATSAAQLQEIYQAFERSGKAGMASKYAKDVKTLWDTKLEQEAGRRPKRGTSGPATLQEEIDEFFVEIDKYTQVSAERAKYKGFFNALPEQSNDKNDITKRSVLDEKGNIARQMSLLRRAQKTPAAELTPEEIANLMNEADQAKFAGFSQDQKDAFAKEYNDNKGGPAEKMNAAKDYMNKQPGVAPQGANLPPLTPEKRKELQKTAGIQPLIDTELEAEQDALLDGMKGSAKATPAAVYAVMQPVAATLQAARAKLANLAITRPEAKDALSEEGDLSFQLFHYAWFVLKNKAATPADKKQVLELLINNFGNMEASGTDANDDPITVTLTLNSTAEDMKWFKAAIALYP